MTDPLLSSDNSEARHGVIRINNSFLSLESPQIYTEERFYRYTAEGVIGHGSFGVVFRVLDRFTGEIVAIKQFLQDPRFLNREVSIMRNLKHSNIIRLRDFFYYTHPQQKELRFLSLVLDYIPSNVEKIIQKAKLISKGPILEESSEILNIKIIRSMMRQLFSGLVYLHHPSRAIMHRDLKPSNLLWDPERCHLLIADFGSAKSLHLPCETHTTYICSRFYRAPELILGNKYYGISIDIWSAGCIFAELLLGQPLFLSETTADHMVEIIRLLGTPSPMELARLRWGSFSALNTKYSENSSLLTSENFIAHSNPFKNANMTSEEISSSTCNKNLTSLICEQPKEKVLSPRHICFCSSNILHSTAFTNDSTSLGDDKVNNLVFENSSDCSFINSKFHQLPPIPPLDLARDVFLTAGRKYPLAVDLIKHLLCYDPRKRFTALQALMHPFFLEE